MCIYYIYCIISSVVNMASQSNAYPQMHLFCFSCLNQISCNYHLHIELKCFAVWCCFLLPTYTSFKIMVSKTRLYCISIIFLVENAQRGGVRGGSTKPLLRNIENFFLIFLCSPLDISQKTLLFSKPETTH